MLEIYNWCPLFCWWKFDSKKRKYVTIFCSHMVTLIVHSFIINQIKESFLFIDFILKSRYPISKFIFDFLNPIFDAMKSYLYFWLHTLTLKSCRLVWLEVFRMVNVIQRNDCFFGTCLFPSLMLSVNIKVQTDQGRVLKRINPIADKFTLLA